MKALVLSMMAAGILLGSTAVVAADTTAMVDKMKAAVTPGEIVLTGSEVKKIHEGKDASEYRVCVKAEKEAAPMKLTYDGQEAVLKPGDCKEIMGKDINATPAQALSGSAHIVATFHRVKK
jgi:hypothetical protein